MHYILIIFIYAGPLANGDSVAIESVPNFTTKASCVKAAEQLKTFTNGTAKVYKYACVEQ